VGGDGMLRFQYSSSRHIYYLPASTFIFAPLFLSFFILFLFE
jgi:hypothetical protein